MEINFKHIADAEEGRCNAVFCTIVAVEGLAPRTANVSLERPPGDDLRWRSFLIFGAIGIVAKLIDVKNKRL